MAITSFLGKGYLLKWASRLRFPYLFLLTAVVFLLNLVIPDIIPFIDEIILGLVTLMLGSARKKPVIEETDIKIKETKQ